MSINVERLGLLIGAALVGALVANSIRPQTHIVIRRRGKERVIGGHDASCEPIVRVPRLSAPEKAGP